MSEKMDVPTIEKDMFEKRIVFMEGDFDEKECTNLCKKLLYLINKDNKSDITIYIDSYGGSVLSFLQIYNIVDNFKGKINTIVMGKAMSAGAMLLMCGTGTRSAFKYSQIMVHELAYETGYKKLHDHEVSIQQSIKLQKILNNIICKHTKIKSKDLHKYKEDIYYSADEAKQLGIIDKIY